MQDGFSRRLGSALRYSQPVCGRVVVLFLLLSQRRRAIAEIERHENSIYLNGVNQAVTSGSAPSHVPLFTRADMITIGKDFNSNPFFDGRIDEFKGIFFVFRHSRLNW